MDYTCVDFACFAFCARMVDKMVLDRIGDMAFEHIALDEYFWNAQSFGKRKRAEKGKQKPLFQEKHRFF